VYEKEQERIRQRLDALAPLMRPEAAASMQAEGFMSRRRKAGTNTLRVVAGWCIFFNAGCVLHRLGELEGDRFRYKPFLCATFPLEQHSVHGWYVRQKGVFGEKWELACLDPAASSRPAAEALVEELALVEATERTDPAAADSSGPR
jgi:hypothetical protein